MVHYHALKGLYVTEKTIGCGGFAKVKLATHVATGEKVAIKIMNKNQLGDDLPRIKLELKALKSLCHDHICKLYQVLETETHYFIIMEYCSGGELFDHIVEKRRLNESESRIFFRQIVSAVAYLHSLGYAHRDLKPENVLLDKDQNLKLIDFGLCARPEGGMTSPLYTSCGSPTYAAPELILGKQYLGQEVDVWAMGVMLYALLVGSLPFDDLNIDGLYKKILSGKYEEPRFISQESKQLIRSMLQVDPKKRITVKELLSHSWLTLGVLEPITCKTDSLKKYDNECVRIIADYYRIDLEIVWKYLKRWHYNYHTATYFLLMSKKKRGLYLKMYSLDASRKKDLFESIEIKSNKIQNKIDDSQLPKIMIHTDLPTNDENTALVGKFVEPNKPTSVKKSQKRLRNALGSDDDASPVPIKKFTPNRITPTTPDSSKLPSTPGSTRRVLNSIEKSLHKVRHVLTPKKSPTSDSTILQPILLTSKNLSNVSTTQCKDPEFVISELSKALQRKGVHCVRKGFTLRGKLEPNVVRRFGGCSFELEICYLPFAAHILTSHNNCTPTKSILKNGPLNTPTDANSLTPKSGNDNNIGTNSAFVGIRRKRLKGDSWCYKRVCEEVLALTCTEFKQITESSV